MRLQTAVLLQTALTCALSAASSVSRRDGTNVDLCPGYAASNVQTTANGMTASLTLAGSPCDAYGTDLQDLTLLVEYQSDSRLHVLIQDAASQVYQVPDSVLPRPSTGNGSTADSDLVFEHVAAPFSFSVKRKSSGEVLFDTSAAGLVFEDQYVRLRTKLPQNPSLYGTGEHTDPFMLNTTDYTRIIWNRDAYTTPPGTNLYGDHPVYFDHRGANGTHGVFLLNSNGKNIKINNDDGQYLEYDLLGGVLDFYFLAGPSPAEVAQQYSEVVGKSAMMPYWGLGFHQCRYGMRDVYEVAEVVANYSSADIPLENMWTDIDYMYLRRVFTLDPERFPLHLMRELVSTLHDRQQKYIVMVDPAIAYQDYPAFNNGKDAGVFYQTNNGSIYQGVVWPGVTAFPDWFHPSTQDYWNNEFSSFFDKNTGVDIDALWIDMNEASNFCNWPCTDASAQAAAMGDPPRPPPIRLGPSAAIKGFPADFQPQCVAQVEFQVTASTRYGENILVIGSASTLGAGDITNAAALDATRYPIWSGTIDLPANTTVSYSYVRTETDGSYIYEATNRTLTTGDCGSSIQTTQDNITTSTPPLSMRKRASGLLKAFRQTMTPRQAATSHVGLPGRDLINPAYDIGNAAGSLSNKTLATDLVNANGMVVYDTHNLYGAQMSEASRLAMLNRRPTMRPMIITRSTFAGSGRQVGHWLGDNAADWAHYLFSIKQVLEFAALYQVPTVGSDVCGFAGNTNELLCARWATLGAFAPFYRNHAEDGSIPHEFYRWPLVAQAARNAIAIRYKLLDYIYTALWEQSQTGMPLVQPMFFVYPNDPATNALAYQYFYGPGILVAPVTQENSTTATVYLPRDLFYDYYTHEQVQGNASLVTLENVAYDTIPLYYKGGSIVVERAASANTTTELRKLPFTLTVAPDAQGRATGTLYLDDGESIEQQSYSYITFTYDQGRLTSEGHFGFDPVVGVQSVTVLGQDGGNATTAFPLTAPWQGQVGAQGGAQPGRPWGPGGHPGGGPARGPFGGPGGPGGSGGPGGHGEPGGWSHPGGH